MPDDISFESNLREWTASLTAVQREQVPFATAKALTDTARDVRLEHLARLPVIFDRPTRFTMNSLQVTPATKYFLSAKVWFKQPTRSRRHYLMPQVEGGSRPHKRFEKWLIERGVMTSSEFAVPAAGAKLDGSGNISAGRIVQILSQFAAGDAFQWETARSRKRAGAKRVRYFVPQPGSRLHRGIWKRDGKKIEPVLIFVSGVAYKVRYRFNDISRSTATMRIRGNFDRALAQALATAR